MVRVALHAKTQIVPRLPALTSTLKITAADFQDDTSAETVQGAVVTPIGVHEKFSLFRCARQSEFGAASLSIL